MFGGAPRARETVAVVNKNARVAFRNATRRRCYVFMPCVCSLPAANHPTMRNHFVSPNFSKSRINDTLRDYSEIEGNRE